MALDEGLAQIVARAALNAAPSMSVTEDGVFENGEGMLDRASPQMHRRWGGTLLHALQSPFVHMPTHDAPRAHGALRFQSTGSAHLGATDIHDRAPVPAIAAQTVACRAKQRVVVLLILERGAVEQLAIAARIHAPVGCCRG
jgi:hypothetical protein